MILLFLNKIFRSKHIKGKDILYVNVRTKIEDLKKITEIAEMSLPYVELKRMDTLEGGGNFVSFLAKSDEISQLAELRENYLSADPDIRISIIDQPDLII
jgi:hypothetical protein